MTDAHAVRIVVGMKTSKAAAAWHAGTTIRFRDIQQFPASHYEVNVPLGYLAKTVADHEKDYGLELDPEFQRGHVWTMAQRRAFMEYMLQGGEGGRVLSFNHCNWNGIPKPGDLYEILDGKQRLTSALMFLRNEVPVFGGYLFRDFTDRPDLGGGFRWRIFALPTRADVLRYYLAMNAGGTPHSAEEIERVRGLLATEVSS